VIKWEDVRNASQSCQSDNSSPSHAPTALKMVRSCGHASPNPNRARFKTSKSNRSLSVVSVLLVNGTFFALSASCCSFGRFSFLMFALLIPARGLQAASAFERDWTIRLTTRWPR
jgi:hypothetical protein